MSSPLPDDHRPEGVIHFSADHVYEALPARRVSGVLSELAAWRSILAGLSIVGQRPDRYDGAGYGNLSGRLGPFPGRRGARPFLVSGTQTGGLECVSSSDFALVSRYDSLRNRVVSRGPIEPSSESMTHGAIYDLGPHIRFVFHVHCPLIWRAARTLKLPISDGRIPYGTPGMAAEIARLARETTLLDRKILAMGGHEDGVITFGRTPIAAGQVLMSTLAEAYRLTFELEGRACAQDAASRPVDRRSAE